MYQERLTCLRFVTKAVASAPPGGTAMDTTARQRSGACPAAPYTVGAPQS